MKIERSELGPLPPEVVARWRGLASDPGWLRFRGDAEALVAKVMTERGAEYLAKCHWKMGQVYCRTMYAYAINVTGLVEHKPELAALLMGARTWLGIPAELSCTGVAPNEAVLMGPLGSVLCEPEKFDA